jgi:regulatory protein
MGQITTEEALSKLQRYCAYQDRCHQEVRSKLLELEVYGNDLEEVMASLISDNFLNEERFTQSFVRGKFRIKKWGRVKITVELKRKNISDYCLKKGLAEINENEYIKTIYELIEKNEKTVKAKNDHEKKKKIADYLARKGYESYLVWECLKDDTDHSKAIYRLIEQKIPQIKAKNDYERKQKLAAYIIKKGFQSNLVWDALNELDNNR